MSTVTVNLLNGGELSETEAQEIRENIQTIMETRTGTCPLYRDFGTDHSFLDYPLEAAQSMMVANYIAAIEEWEDRVLVKEINFDMTEALNGQISSEVVAYVK